MMGRLGSCLSELGSSLLNTGWNEKMYRVGKVLGAFWPGWTTRGLPAAVPTVVVARRRGALAGSHCVVGEGLHPALAIG